MIINMWGPLDVDVLPVFCSNFWCYQSSGVDALTFD